MDSVTHRVLLSGGLTLLLAGCAGALSWQTNGSTHTRHGPTTPVTTPAPVLPPVAAGHYRVAQGDTMYSIAFRNQVDFRELAQWNGIGSDYLIHPGQILRLSAPSAPRLLAPESGEVVVQPIPVPVETSVPKPLPPVELPPPDSVAEARPRPTPTPVAVLSGPVTSTSGAAATPNAAGWVWPTRGVVQRGFAPSQGSRGLMIGGQVGQPVVAAGNGRVVYSGNALKGYGELIIIKHDEVHLSAYGFNRARLVKEGDEVKAGQVIAEMGEGPERKPLLHFEIRERGKPIDPLRFLPRPG